MERALVARARSGDRDAFEAAVSSRIDAVYRTSLAILGDTADAAGDSAAGHAGRGTVGRARNDRSRFAGSVGPMEPSSPGSGR
jgi:hypothetical protein